MCSFGMPSPIWVMTISEAIFQNFARLEFQIAQPEISKKIHFAFHAHRNVTEHKGQSCS